MERAPVLLERPTAVEPASSDTAAVRVVSVGYDFDDERVEHEHYRSARTLLEFDLVIWDPAQVADGFHLEPDRFEGRPVVSRARSASAIATVERRFDEMDKLLSLGKVLVVFVPSSPTFFVYTGRSTNMGTAAKPRMQHDVREVKMDEMFPFRLRVASAAGSERELKTGDPFATFWRAMRPKFAYQAYMTEVPVEPAVVVRGTVYPVAGYGPVGAGTVILLPDFAEDAWGETRPETHDEYAGYNVSGFSDALLTLVEELRGSDADAPPSWTSRYLLPSEAELGARVAEAERNLESVLKELDEKKTAVLRRQRLKRLFSATGRGFELAVRQAFEALGCEVEDGPPNRTDFIVRCGDEVSVVEAKGLGGSAAERHSAQLEKWVAEYIEATERHPKPILVVNAFRGEQRLASRGTPFPHQMLDYATKRDHLMVTGLQLLGAVLDVEAHPERAEDIRASLFSSVGVWGRYQDFGVFLTEEEQLREGSGAK